MPVYEFACAQCGHRFEEFTWSSADRSGTACPSCGASEVKRLMSVFGIGRAETKRAPGAAPAAACGPGCGCHAPARMPSVH